MCAHEKPVEEDIENSRVCCIKKIVDKLQLEHYKLPTPMQQRIYQEALCQLVRLHFDEGSQQPIQDNEEKVVSTMHASCCKVDNHGRRKTRRQILREMLSNLKNLERRRLYNPPQDNEIGYYQVMKNIIKLIITFTDMKEGSKSSSEDTKFHHFRRFSILSYVIELEELQEQLKDISSHLTDMNVRNDFSLKPFMGIKCNFKASSISWNKKKSSLAFYQHKFLLALVDLWSSDLAVSPPKLDEKRLYDNVINHVDAPSPSEETSERKEYVPFFLEDLPYFFRNRIASIVDSLVQSSNEILSKFLAKLSINSTFDELIQCYKNDRGRINKELVHHCQVSPEHYLDYVANLDRCIIIMKYIYSLISASSTTINQIYEILYAISKGNVDRETEWELIHALTLSNCGTYEFPDEDVEIDGGTMFSLEGASENEVILWGILQDLQHIGISDADRTLDGEESDLFDKVWKKVASAVEFFYSAMAYNQRKSMLPTLSSDGILKVGRLKKHKQTNHPNMNVDFQEGYRSFRSIHFQIAYLGDILEAIKKDLLEEPIRQNMKMNMLCSKKCSMQNVECRDMCLLRRFRLSSKKHIDW